MNLQSPHRPVTALEILNSPSENVVNSGLSVCGRRPFIKCEIRRAFARVHAFFKKVVLTPVVEDLFFQVREAHFVRNLLEHPLNLTRRKSETRGHKARGYEVYPDIHLRTMCENARAAGFS